jgi:hypothetical protein
VSNGAQNNVEQISYHVTLSFEMIHMSHVHSNIAITAKSGELSIGNFTRF